MTDKHAVENIKQRVVAELNSSFSLFSRGEKDLALIFTSALKQASKKDQLRLYEELDALFLPANLSRCQETYATQHFDFYRDRARYSHEDRYAKSNIARNILKNAHQNLEKNFLNFSAEDIDFAFSRAIDSFKEIWSQQDDYPTLIQFFTKSLSVIIGVFAFMCFYIPTFVLCAPTLFILRGIDRLSDRLLSPNRSFHWGSLGYEEECIAFRLSEPDNTFETFFYDQGFNRIKALALRFFVDITRPLDRSDGHDLYEYHYPRHLHFSNKLTAVLYRIVLFILALIVIPLTVVVTVFDKLLLAPFLSMILFPLVSGISYYALLFINLPPKIIKFLSNEEHGRENASVEQIKQQVVDQLNVHLVNDIYCRNEMKIFSTIVTSALKKASKKEQPHLYQALDALLQPDNLKHCQEPYAVNYFDRHRNSTLHPSFDPYSDSKNARNILKTTHQSLLKNFSANDLGVSLLRAMDSFKEMWLKQDRYPKLVRPFTKGLSLIVGLFAFICFYIPYLIIGSLKAVVFMGIDALGDAMSKKYIENDESEYKKLKIEFEMSKPNVTMNTFINNHGFNRIGNLGSALLYFVLGEFNRHDHLIHKIASVLFRALIFFSALILILFTTIFTLIDKFLIKPFFNRILFPMVIGISTAALKLINLPITLKDYFKNKENKDTECSSTTMCQEMFSTISQTAPTPQLPNSSTEPTDKISEIRTKYKLQDMTPASLARALRNAAVNDFVEDIHFILSLCKTCIDIPDNNPAHQKTALHWAVEKGHIASVQALIQTEARYDIQAKNGQTALDIAKTLGAELLSLFPDQASPPSPRAWTRCEAID